MTVAKTSVLCFLEVGSRFILISPSLDSGPAYDINKDAFVFRIVVERHDTNFKTSWTHSTSGFYSQQTTTLFSA
jgi:hypothetical protein